MSEVADIAIVGAGVVGLAVAAAVARDDRTVYVLEKNDSFGRETSSRNSGVIHAGIYYPTGSLKAQFCVEGNGMLYDLCAKHGIPHRKAGKLIVATGEEELGELYSLLEQGRANGARDLQLISRDKVEELEPNVNAIAAIWSPSTGIVDSHSLMLHYINEATLCGAQVAYRCEVTGIEKIAGGYRVSVQDWTGGFSFDTSLLVNCAGLHSDGIAALAGIDIDAAGYRLHYCRGEYYTVDGSRKGLVNHLVYPVPLPSNVGMGIHITIDLEGRLRLGPSTEYVDAIDYSMDGRNKELFYESARKYLPALEPADIEPDMVGIRPKLQPPGGDVRDFVIREESDRGLPGLIDLIGIESPGLTASPAIGKYVAELADRLLDM